VVFFELQLFDRSISILKDIKGSFLFFELDPCIPMFLAAMVLSAISIILS